MVKWKVKELKLGQMETNMKECGTMTFNMALVYFILLRQTKKPLKNGEKANAGPGTKLPNQLVAVLMPHVKGGFAETTSRIYSKFYHILQVILIFKFL